MLFVPSLVNTFYSPGNNFAEDKRMLDSVIAELHKDSSLILSATDIEKPIQEKDRKAIDPNSAPIEALESLFGKRVGQTIANYRKKGGRFKSKADLKKVYGMNEKLYTSCAPYLLLPDEVTGNHTSGKLKAPKELVDINKADSAQLEKLAGIGPVLAARIIKYKTKLGGYVDPAQLLEVYGIKREVYDLLKDQLHVEASFVPTKIPLNIATYNELKNHPYIGGKLASSILKFRKDTKSISSMEELVGASLLTIDKATKLIPYVSF